MLKKFLITLAVALAAFAGVAALQPAEFEVSRSAAINAPASVIFAQVNNLRKWEAWSPWAKLDPDATTTFDGPAAGAGAAMSWDGNMNVGAGTMTITESRAPQTIGFHLDFQRPMASTSAASFTFEEVSGQTTVTWTMSGTRNFAAKAMSLVFNCDKMVGEQFEKGLQSLKEVAESQPASSALPIEEATPETESKNDRPALKLNN